MYKRTRLVGKERPEPDVASTPKCFKCKKRLIPSKHPKPVREGEPNDVKGYYLKVL